ncbi:MULTISPECIES: LysE family translocator [unclassified Aureispira]|uniref:LysE family translocator n=1 Tax=unclassified Aureispira TaxID=2649989 RepID=UPI0006989620|nr:MULTISPECIES: LysE family transporter [unclassified Aureispira]WMX15625.1 LysE family transporter [Aureispira sp. CCB-E]
MIVSAILEGALAGLILSVFVGPIFFTMLQLGVEHGFKAAFALALGQWVSDLLYIFLAFWGAIWVEEIIADEVKQATFVWYSGTIGGCLLLLFGAGLLLTKSVSTKGLDDVEIVDYKVSKKAYFAYFLQGFLINTINPTPLLFWMGLMAFAINSNYIGGATAALYIAVMSVVILTDCLKIYLAKTIRNKLQAHHFLYVRRLAGLVLGGFGLVLLLKVTVL